ncbi:MAG: ABC transporter ATP-binding protein [Eubacteriales bacterium]|nr:ABC transporter ATP-binding protein [Eubacteriales bacterium]
MNMKALAKQELKYLRGLQLFTMLLVALQHFTAVLSPYFMGKLVDNVQEPLPVILRLAGILLGMVFADFALNWVQNYFWFKMDYKSMFLLRSAVFQKVLEKPFPFYYRHPKGDVVSRVVDDSAQYAEKEILRVPMLAANISNLIIVFGMIFILQPKIGGILLAMCISYFFSYRYINGRLRAASAKERERHAGLLQMTNNLYDGFLTIKLFLREKVFSQKYYDTAEKLCQGSVALQKWKSLAQSLSEMILALMPVVAVIVGAVLIALGQCTLGAIFSIVSYVSLLGEPIRNLTDYNIMLQRGKINEKRLDEIIEKENASCSAAEENTEEFRIREISFHNVDFSYYDGKKILERFCMNLKPGKRIGVVGRTGSGKTTLLRLLTAQDTASQGEIRVNGTELRTMNAARYLERIAIVPQDIFLYDADVIENIIFGRKTDRERLEYLKRKLEISAYENREIGKLSGGERKRIGIARALLSDYDLLILDEPTADVDALMEQKIIELIQTQLSEEKMLFVITHRPAILDICTDKIVLGDEAYRGTRG